MVEATQVALICGGILAFCLIPLGIKLWRYYQYKELKDKADAQVREGQRLAQAAREAEAADRARRPEYYAELERQRQREYERQRAEHERQRQAMAGRRQDLMGGRKSTGPSVVALGIFVVYDESADQSRSKCSSCQGRGNLFCHKCSGSGFIACEPCNGTGRFNQNGCLRCNASGRKECWECLRRGEIKCRFCKGTGQQ